MESNRGFRYVVTYGANACNTVMMCSTDDTMEAYIQGLETAKATSPDLSWIVLYVEDMDQELKDKMLRVSSRPKEWRVINGILEKRPKSWIDCSPAEFALGDTIVVSAQFDSETPQQPKLSFEGVELDSPAEIELDSEGEFKVVAISAPHLAMVRVITV